MANIKSQKKRILTNAKASDRNKAVKSELRTRVRNAQTTAGTPEGDASLRLAVKRIDMAALSWRMSRLLRRAAALG